MCILLVYLEREDVKKRALGPLELDSCELPCGCWELNPDLLEEHSVLLTAEQSKLRGIFNDAFQVKRESLAECGDIGLLFQSSGD